MNPSLTDRVVLIKRCLEVIRVLRDWVPFDELVLGSSSHPGQIEWLEKSISRENVLHPGNGWGKTEVIARKHLYFVLSHFNNPDYRTLNAAITQEQSELAMDRILAYVHNSPLLKDWLILSAPKFPRPMIKWANGAITEFKTTKKKGESIEGKEYGYISVDEIALEPHVEFLREKILLPRIRKYKDSQVDYYSTPKGMNAYYRVVLDVQRKGGYVRGGSSFENPHIDHSLLEYLTSTWSQAKVDQVVLGKFVDTAEMMFASRVPLLFDDSLSLEDKERGHKYLEGWDLARGRKGEQSDQTVGYRLDITQKPVRIVKRWAFQLPWTEKERDNMKFEGKVERSSIEREIRTSHYEAAADIRLDSTGVGDTLYGMLQDIVKPVDFRGGNKDRLLDHLQCVIDAGLLKSPFIPELADEMTIYQRDDKNLDTDNLMALAIAATGIKLPGNSLVESWER